MALKEAHLGRSESRAERLKRLESILYRNPHGASARELARALNVDRRTIYRDIDSLTRVGVPVYQEGGRFCLDRECSLTTVRLNLNEAMALYIAARLLSRHSDEHNPHVISALEKLATASPDPTISEHIGRAAGVVRNRRRNPSYVRVLETLTRAWADKRQVHIKYCSSDGKITERVIDPYFLEPSPVGYACYVIAYDHLRSAVRTFKVERIKEATILDREYEVDPDFDPYERLQGCWGVMWGDETRVRLKFSPAVARRVKESQWHPSQVVEDCSDGACILTVRVGATIEMLPWVRSWGGEVEVLEPPELREQVVQEIAKLRKAYGV
ncbi:MAG TPA: transcriptional regulator [Firmicutes bacterium]|nr:transcriptional regulator [Bacillota bacterium]